MEFCPIMKLIRGSVDLVFILFKIRLIKVLYKTMLGNFNYMMTLIEILDYALFPSLSILIRHTTVIISNCSVS